MDFEALPDEMILLIFSMVEDGLTLLDSVPLVCKRWLRLSRDPKAWSGVRLSIPMCIFGKEDHANPLLDNARVLLHAPSLRELCMTSWKSCILNATPLVSCKQDSGIFAALRRTQALAREIRLPEPYFVVVRLYDQLEHVDKRVIDYLIEYLERCGTQIRVLNMGRLLRAGGRNAEAVLAQLGMLERLELCLDPDYPYAGELAGISMPKLTHLTIQFINVTITTQSNTEMHNMKRLVVDLLRGAEGSLRIFMMKEGWRLLPVDVRNAICRCKELTSFECHLPDVALLWELPLPHTLVLSEYDVVAGLPEDSDYELDDDEEPMDPEDIISSLMCFFGVCKPLSNLRSLEVSDYFFEFSPRIRSSPRHLMLMMFKAMAPIFANVTTLRSGDFSKYFPESVADMVAAMPRLQSAVINGFPSHVLPKILSLKDLRSLSGSVECRRGEKKSCQDAIDYFQRQMPDVEMNLVPAVRGHHDDELPVVGLKC